MSEANAVMCGRNQIDPDQVPLPCSAAEQKSISELLEALASVRGSACGLQLVSAHDKLTQKGLTLGARGTAIVMPGTPFAIKIANESKKLNKSRMIKLHKSGMKLKMSGKKPANGNVTQRCHETAA